MNKILAVLLCILGFALTWCLAFLPALIVYLIYGIAGPIGFWQQIVFWAVAIFFGGSIQFFSFVMGIAGTGGIIKFCSEIWDE